MMHARSYALLWLTALAGSACSGSSTVETIVVPAVAGGGASIDAGGVGSIGSIGASGASGASGTSAGGAAGGNTARGGSAGASACSSDADCAPLNGDCARGACGLTGCQALPLAEGTPAPNAAFVACHVSVCDGLGNVTEQVDPRSLPPATPGCTVPTCDAQGTLGSAPLGAGTACSVNDGTLCDGSGNCVACLTTADCKPGLTCTAHSCGGLECMDGEQDGDETDSDCGGSCAPCANSKKCAIDQDCSSDDCDALNLVCLPASCTDTILDDGEIDVDCGGPCSPCVPGSKCLVNADCTTNKCDAMSLHCAGNECLDGRKNGYETDIDCGGNDVCIRCLLGKHCLLPSDCVGGLICNSSVTPHVCAHATN